MSDQKNREMPYDPDFDSPSHAAQMDSTPTNILSNFKPKTAFWLGIGSGLGLIFTIGFFILLFMFLKGGASTNLAQSASGTVPSQGGPGTAPQPFAPPPQPPPSRPAPAGALPQVTKADHIKGNLNAPVVLVEYSDSECPFCKRHHPNMQRVLQEYGDKVAWVYRHFPLSFHANAAKEDEAAECASEIGGNSAFWKYIDKIFERTTSNGTGFALDQLVPLAKEIGLNEAKFKACLDSGKYVKHVQDDLIGGQNAGVNGTPATFVVTKGGTQLISGAVPYESIKQVIDSSL